MEGAQVFTCKTANNLRSILSRNNDATMFLKVENSKISGKGYICNTDGKNGYSDEFEVGIGKISSIFETEYSGEPALAINTSLDNLYGSKKVQLVFPQLKDMDLAAKLLKKLRADGGFTDDKASTAAYGTKIPEPAQVKKEEPAPEPAAPAAKSVAELRSATTAKNAQAKTAAPEPAPAPAKAPAKPAAEKPVLAEIEMPALDETKEEEITPMSTPSAVMDSPLGGAAELEPVSEPEPVKKTGKMTAEEYNERLDKLNVLRDCGVLAEKEYYTKKFEIVCEYNDLTDFNEKIQKLIVLVDCGLLSEKEFEGNCMDIIKECCNTEVDDPAEYRKNIQKLVCMEAGGILSPEEYLKYKQVMLDDVVFTLADTPEVFIRKLKKLPVLVDCQMITAKEHTDMMNDLYSMIDVAPDKPLAKMVDRLNKWPLLAQEHIISEAELHKKQAPVIEACMQKALVSPEDVNQVGENLVALKDGNWLTEQEFAEKKKELLAKIDTIPDYINRVTIYVALPKMGLETQQEYEAQKKKCIDDIFSPYKGMDEFKQRVTNLLDLQKAGMLTEDEFVAHKAKLMSSL